MFFHGKSIIGTVSKKILNQDALKIAVEGMQLLADENNIANISIGGNLVTVNIDINTDGFPLGPGKGLFIPFRNLDGVYAISTTMNQILWYFID